LAAGRAIRRQLTETIFEQSARLLVSEDIQIINSDRTHDQARDLVGSIRRLAPKPQFTAYEDAWIARIPKYLPPAWSPKRTCVRS
jgi:hypothetical protein